MEIPIYTKGQKGKPGDHIDSHIYDDFEKVIQTLINNDEITDPTQLGICKLVVDKGTEVLTQNQMYHLEKVVAIIDSECSICSETLSWEDLHMLEGSPTESRRCSNCEHSWSKI